MAVPFRRTSKTKKRMRRTHLKKEVGALTTCPKCGYYKNVEVVKVEKEEK